MYIHNMIYMPWVETNKNVLMTQKRNKTTRTKKKVAYTARSPGAGQPPFVNTDLTDTVCLSCHPHGIALLMVTRWLQHFRHHIHTGQCPKEERTISWRSLSQK